jgi:hypothetical protein
MLQSISHHSSLYLSTQNTAENEAVPEMSKVTYYHSNICLALNEPFINFSLLSLATKALTMLTLLREWPLLMFPNKINLLF